MAESTDSLDSLLDAPPAAGGDTVVAAPAGGPPPPLLRTVGDYELVAELARGGMGVVYRGWQVSLNRDVAVKMLLAGTAASATDVTRFWTEAEAAAALDHPHILPIYEVGEHAGQHYFSMKLVTGGTLADRLKAAPRPPARELVGLLAKVCRAVHFAHQRGVLHRDLKPANILLDADNTPYVADFGLAKRADADGGATRTGAAVGTPAYMPPEQARGEKGISTAADVYALGAILYEVLTGRPPFAGGSDYEVIKQVIEAEPVAPRVVNRKADRDLAAIALKCLEKNPAGRYGSAADLSDDLDRWAAGEPTVARPPTLIGSAWRWVRRHATAAVAIPALGVLWGGALGLFLISGHHVGFRVTGGEYLIPPNTTWHSPLRYVQLLETEPAFRHGVWAVAVAISLGVGPLVRRVARPKDGRAAFGFAAAVGLIAMQAAALLVGPFLTTEDAGVTARVHAIATVDDLTRLSMDAADGARRALANDLDRLTDAGDNLSLENPERPRPEAGRDATTGDLRRWRMAHRTNRVHDASVGMSTGTLFGLVFFLGLSGFSMWASYLATGGGRWYRGVQLYGGFYGGGLTLTVFTAVVLVSALRLPARSDPGVYAVFADGARGLWPAYQVVAVYVIGVLVVCHRSAARRWAWWAHDLVMLGWTGVFAGVGLAAWLSR